MCFACGVITNDAEVSAPWGWPISVESLISRVGIARFQSGSSIVKFGSPAAFVVLTVMEHVDDGDAQSRVIHLKCGHGNVVIQT